MTTLTLNLWSLRQICLTISFPRKPFPQTESFSSPAHWSMQVIDWILVIFWSRVCLNSDFRHSSSWSFLSIQKDGDWSICDSGMSPTIPSPPSFDKSQFGLATTSIELNSLKKAYDTSQQNLFTVFTFISGVGDQLQAWVLTMMNIKWSFVRDLIDKFLAELTFHVST